MTREQFLLQGNATIDNGGVISSDTEDTHTLVSSTSSFDSSLGGNPTINYAANVSTFVTLNVYSLNLQGLRKTY